MRISDWSSDVCSSDLNLAIFARRAIQIEYVDPDPALNQQLQVLNNIGTVAPHSVVSFGDSDVLFLSESGVRSLRARDSSNSASVSDVGTPVDQLILDAVRDLDEDVVEAAVAIIERSEEHTSALQVTNAQLV